MFCISEDYKKKRKKYNLATRCFPRWALIRGWALNRINTVFGWEGGPFGPPKLRLTHPSELFGFDPKASKSAFPHSAFCRFKGGGGGEESGSSMFNSTMYGCKVPNRYVRPVTCGNNERIFHFERMRKS